MTKSEYKTKIRILIGVLIAPLIYVVIWSLPYINEAMFKSWVIVSIFFAYLSFLVIAGICHLILVELKTEKLHNYFLIMFLVSAFLHLAISLSSISELDSLYYSQTHVVENNSITLAGYLLQLKAATVYGLISAFVMAIFWLIAVFKPSAKLQSA